MRVDRSDRAMSEPVEISASHFFDFIAAPSLAVVFVSMHPAYPLNRAIGRRLEEAQGSDVSFGTIGVMELIVTGGRALSFLRRGLSSCGVSVPLEVLPGYYLFRQGRMLAWDSGLPDRSDAGPILGGSLLGMIAFAFSRDLALLGKAMRFAVDEATAARLALHFGRIVEEDGGRSRHEGAYAGHASPRDADDDVMRAYRTLGVTPEATDQEVDAAWRRLRVDLHPDRTAGDPAEFERRSRFAAQINWARDAIRAHRARAPR
jgi:hypothetical protein